MADQKRCATIALIGEPNTGKSTLLNQLVGQKVSIVSPKVQTTRIKVRGIVVDGDVQLVFVDTPGIFDPKRGLHNAMLKEAWGSVGQVNEVAVLLDCRKPITPKTREIIEKLNQREILPLIILNKVDKLDKHKLLPLAQEISNNFKFKEIFMLSALKSDGVDRFKNYLLRAAPEGVWLYPEDQVSDLPSRVLAAEETREKLFMNLDQELPYGIAVNTEKWQESPGKITIHQIIYVARENQKQIVIGKGGAMLKKVGEQARKSLEKIFEKKVDLFLHIKVKEDWENDAQISKETGFEA